MAPKFVRNSSATCIFTSLLLRLRGLGHRWPLALTLRSDFCPNGLLDFLHHTLVISQVLLGTFTALSHHFTFVLEETAALLNDAFFDSNVEDITFARDTILVHVELGDFEWRCEFVFNHLHTMPTADDLFAFLNVANLADIDTL